MSGNEGEFCRALEIALNSPERKTRVQRINSGDMVFRRSTGSVGRFRGAKEGTADLVGFVMGTGWYLEIETKAAKGAKREAQEKRGEFLNKSGAIWVKATRASDDLIDAVVTAVRHIDHAILNRKMSERRCLRCMRPWSEYEAGQACDPEGFFAHQWEAPE